MPDAPVTPPSLLFRIRDPGDREAWQRFVELYGPLIYRFGRKRGLQDADAADLTQVVMKAVVGAIGRFDYDPKRVRFHSWLYGVVRNQYYKVLDQIRLSHVKDGSDAQQRLAEQAEREDGAADLWEQEYRRSRFLWAAEQVRGMVEESSWQAFWQTAVENRGATEVAADLKMKTGAVYTAKSRVLDRIRNVLKTLEEE